MNKLADKLAVITGASAGIGRACADILAANGANLLLLARREEKIRGIASDLARKHRVNVDFKQLDVRDRSSVASLGEEFTNEGIQIDILINNAGLARGTEKLHEARIDDWEEMIDTNIKGLLYMSRALVPIMLKSSEFPLVINIGSTAGIQAYGGGAVYCATKSAVGFLSDGLRIDTVDTNMKVCNIRPGLTNTEFSTIRFHGDKNKADNVYSDIEPLYAADIAEAVLFVASRPNHVQISELTIMPNSQASGTVIHRG